MREPLPLQDVLGIVERRRRRRATVRSVAGPALSVAAVGVAGLIVVAVQAGPADVAPAAAPPLLTTLPAAAALPSFDPGYLVPDYLPTLADTVVGSEPLLDEATTLQQAWGLEYGPAKAVVAKADLTGTVIDPTDPQGDDQLVSRFEQAGYTDRDAQVLADAWDTDARTAQVLGGILVEAGLVGG